MTCEEFEELSGAYVLDAVTPEERQAAQEHLATCDKCTRLAQELRAAVSVLPYAAPQVTPSPALLERIIQAIRQKPRPVATPPPRRVRQPTRRRAGWATRILAVAALVLFLITGGMTAWNVSLQHQLTTVQASNTQLTGQLSALQQSNAAQARQIGALNRQVAQVFNIAGTPAAHTASGSLYYLPQQNITVLVLHNLPALQGSHIYQGWLLHKGAPTSIGVLSEQNGIASLIFPGAIGNYDTAAVSQEAGPGPTPRAPAGKVVAAGLLQHPTQAIFTI
ncbi:MAG TPA: anti-sigma factor [Ktedonobacteraceae bacterium]|nr:anti-sigma factor [Ktedonobacteraceae bacterium]